MCLIALALDQSRRFPLVLASNRDEFHDRPTARLAWWSPEPGAPEILSGRDLQAGGTWLGLNASGRLACVTNVRAVRHAGQGGSPTADTADAPSRGRIVTGWLHGGVGMDRYWMRTALSGYARFNVLAADFSAGECFWGSSEAAMPMRLERGLYGLSNAGLDTPWPKVQILKARLRASLVQGEASDGAEALAARLFEALTDRNPAADADLPETGVGLDVERMLSSAFIASPDGRYGTRCSTVVITERVKRQRITHVFERSFSAQSSLALMRHVRLADWPPKYSAQPDRLDSGWMRPEVIETADAAAIPTAPQRASRPPSVRSRGVIKPSARRVRASRTA